MAKELIEFGGQANVILRANIDFTVNDIEYKKDDIILYLEDVNLDFTYNETISDKTVNSRNLLAFDIRKLNAVRISSNPLTMQYVELFGEKVKDNFTYSVVEDTEIQDNKFYPTKPIATGEKSIYIMNVGNYGVEYDAESGEATINIEEDIDGVQEQINLEGTYTIVYKTLVDNPAFNINNNYTLPYFSMEVNGIGNINKVDGNINIFIPAVSLLTRPDYSLSNTITYQSLDFKIIDIGQPLTFGIY